MTLRFHAAGIPVPQGSKRHVGGGRMIDANPNTRPWRDTIAWEARHAAHNAPMQTGPAHVEIIFTFPHPKHHYRTGRYAHELKPTAPIYHTSKPDLDKLVRTVLDALVIAGVIRDDAQVAQVHAVKLYPANGEGGPGVSVKVEPASTAHLQLAGHARLVDELITERYA